MHLTRIKKKKNDCTFNILVLISNIIYFHGLRLKKMYLIDDFQMFIIDYRFNLVMYYDIHRLYFVH